MTTPQPTITKPAQSDDEFQAELRAACLQEGAKTMQGIQQALQTFAKNVKDAAAHDTLYRKVHTLAGSAGLAGLHTIHRIASALENLLREIKEKPDGINPSALRTIAQSVDFLNVLFARPIPAEHDRVPTLNVFALDDEDIALRSISRALQKEQILPVCAKNPEGALKIVADQQFDLVITDIEMEGMNGMQFCTRLRAMARYHKTPVVFVTSQTSFENRAQVILSGGNDLIAKPFLFTEFAVKALVLAVKSKLAAATAQS